MSYFFLFKGETAFYSLIDRNREKKVNKHKTIRWRNNKNNTALIKNKIII